MDLNSSKMSVDTQHGLVEHRLPGLIFYTIIFIIGLLVNFTAIWVFALTTKKRNSVSVYMVNVAVVDLTFILMLPIRIVYYHWDYWPLGDIVCRISAALTIFYPCMALWLFALISADRFMAIVQPMHGKELRNIPKAVVASLGVWLMTVCSTIPIIFSSDNPDQIYNFTTCHKIQDIVYMQHDNPVNFVRLVFFFLLPICIMIGCYIVIVHSLIHGRTSKLKPKVKQKSIRIIVTLIIQVLVCFVPFHVCLVSRLVNESFDDGFNTWAVVTTYMMNLSTVLDIILYYIVSKQFQDRVISVILYRNYLRSVRRKSRHTGSLRSLSNITSAVL